MQFNCKQLTFGSSQQNCKKRLHNRVGKVMQMIILWCTYRIMSTWAIVRIPRIEYPKSYHQSLYCEFHVNCKILHQLIQARIELFIKLCFCKKRLAFNEEGLPKTCHLAYTKHPRISKLLRLLPR